MNTPVGPQKTKRARAKIRSNWSLGQSPPNASQRPDFFRLPKAKSGGDPYFHFSRSLYYQGENRGWWKLIRITQAGKQRGVTLIEYAAVAAFVRSKMEGANT